MPGYLFERLTGVEPQPDTEEGDDARERIAADEDEGCDVPF